MQSFCQRLSHGVMEKRQRASALDVQWLHDPITEWLNPVNFSRNCH